MIISVSVKRSIGTATMPGIVTIRFSTSRYPTKIMIPTKKYGLNLPLIVSSYSQN